MTLEAGDLARRVADAYAGLPAIEAVALGGSRGAGNASPGSDVDLYVYASAPVPLAARAEVARRASSRAEVGNAFFEPGDEWIDAPSGLHVDVMFRDVGWIEDQLDRVLVRHEASLGYSTAIWHGIRSSAALFDRSGWYARLRERAAVPYPEALRRAIVARNRPLLAANLSSYVHQLERASARRDGVSVNHRVAAFLASLFDVLFAVNRVPHPGEKRLVALAEALCPVRPPSLAEDVAALLAAAGAAPAEVPARAARLAAALDGVLRAEGLLDVQPFAYPASR